MTRKEYYVQSTKYQLFKLIRETPQLDLDRCLTSSLMKFVAYFKYKIIEAYMDARGAFVLNECRNNFDGRPQRYQTILFFLLWGPF